MNNQFFVNLPTIIYFFIISTIIIYNHINKKSKIIKIFLIISSIISAFDIINILINSRIINDPNLTYSSKYGGTSYFPTINQTSLHIRCFNYNSNNSSNNSNSDNSNSNNKEITILFEAGTPFYSTVWGNVIGLIQSNGFENNDNNQDPNFNIKQYCIYDRYGYGWSKLKENRGIDGLTVVNDLKQYLNEIGINDNLLLVGWSYGGTLTQLFTYQYPELVKGLVLVDSMIVEDLNNTWLISGINQGVTSFNILKYLLPTGITRFLTSFYPLQSGYFNNDKHNSSVNLDEKLKSSTDSIYLTYSNIDASSNELSAILGTISQQNSIINNHSTQFSNIQYLGNTPLVVLTALDNGTPDWNSMQTNITNYSSISKQIFTTSDHFIPLENPLSIVNSISSCLNIINNNNNK